MMNCVTVACSEFANLNYLAFYAVLSNAIDASFGISTLVMLGHLGKGHLSAGVIALAFYNISWYFMEGLLTAQDCLVARSFALNDRESARYWSYISGAVAFLLCIPATVLFIMAAIIIQYAFLIRPHTAVKAAEFLILLLPGLWAHSLYRVAQKYLQCQQKMAVPIMCELIGISANLLGSYLLSFVFGLGFSGCGIAMSISRGIMLTCITVYLINTEDVERAVEELTTLTHSLQHDREHLNMDETVDRTGSQIHQKKPILVTEASAKRPSRKNSRKGRVAPVATGDPDETPLNGRDDETKEDGVEMVDLEGQTHRLAVSEVPDAETARADTEDGPIGAAEDSQALLGGSPGSHRSGLGTSSAPKRAIFADALRFVLMGIPGGLVLGMEFWIFEIVTVIVAHMGSVVVGTNQILLTITSFFFLSIPFALSIAATVQISRQLAKKRYKKARTTAYLCLLEGSVLMALAAGVMYLLRDYTGYIFTNNEDILRRLRTLAPYAAGFQVAYGVYGSAQGVLRATSHQLDLLGWTFIALWVVGLPIGLYLCFVTRPTYGLEGLWVGLIVGMGLLAFAVVVQVYLLDWEKEARKAEYRLRRGAGSLTGLGTDLSAVGGTRRGVRAADLSIPGLSRRLSNNTGSSMNPLQRLYAAEDFQSDTPLPSIGSKAVGGLPLQDLLRVGEDMDELEYVEFGADIGTDTFNNNGDGDGDERSAAAGHKNKLNSGGRHAAAAGGIEMALRYDRLPLPDDEEDFKRNK